MSDEDHLYRIGEFADKAGVTVRTVRYYDLEGLLVPSRRSFAGFRLYDERDAQKLRKILVLKDLGLSLESVRQALETDQGDLGGMLSKRLADISTDIERLKGVEATILAIQGKAANYGPIDWETLFQISAMARREGQMSTYTISEEQMRSTITSIIYPKGKPSWYRFGPAIAILAIAAIIVVSLVLRQYGGAAIGTAIGLLFLYVSTKGRQLSAKSEARNKRLASVQYKVDATEAYLQLDYDQSSFRMPYANLHITKRGKDFYSVVHELSLMAFVPVSALSEEQKRILDSHTEKGLIDWEARLPKAAGA
jgi:DNA-binding transcriptional MerR regulator